MHKALAIEQAKRLRELSAELRLCKPEEQMQIASRMSNLLPGAYVVNSSASQHIEEALRKLKYRDLAVVNAALSTIDSAVSALERTAISHAGEHFTVPAARSRMFARPVVGDELRSLVEKGRLLHEAQSPFILAIDAPSHVEQVLLEADPQTLLPVLSRMGFPNAEALVFFTTRTHPASVTPAPSLPLLKLAKLRSGVGAQVIHHRVLV